MKLRYEFSSTQKTYRTFPQKVVQSTGLADRLGFLKWCCPFCLDTPRSESRKSSVPVIRITRPRSPDSDSETDYEPVEKSDRRRRRRQSAGSCGSSEGDAVANSRSGKCGQDIGGKGQREEGDAGSEELDLIAEEAGERNDLETTSITSKESVVSKESNKSRRSIWSKSSDKDDSDKKRKAAKARDKSSSGSGRDSRRGSSSDGIRTGRDALKDGAKDKPRSPVKKVFKHLKRTMSSTSTSSTSGGRDDSRSSKYTAPAESLASDTTVTRASDRHKSGGVDGRGRGAVSHNATTGDVIGHDVCQAKGHAALPIVDHRLPGTHATNHDTVTSDTDTEIVTQPPETGRPRPPVPVHTDKDRKMSKAMAVEGEDTASTPSTEALDQHSPSDATATHDAATDESTGSLDEGVGGQKSGSPSPLVGSAGRISGRDSVTSLASSTDASTATHPDEDIERLLQINERKRNSLTPLGSRSESMASVCSAGAEGRYGTVVVKGELELGLQYNYKEGQLEARVVQCRDLAAVDIKRNRSDPYVKVYLLPDKSKSGKRKTKVKKHTLNPSFDEVLRFTTTMSELEARTLWVSVWHSDMFGRNDFLGEVVIPLADTVFDDVTPKWYPLQERTEPMDELSYSPRGDLILALKFVPPDAVSGKKARRSRGALHVLVKEAKSLAPARPHATADPVCKGLLLPEKGKASKQKTSVCRKTLNPTWNHTLVFDDTSLQELTERSLELSVWDHDRLGASQFLGGCRLNLGKGKHAGRVVEWMEAAGMEVKLWEQMLDRPNLWVEGSIMLRPSMDKPIYSSSMTE